MQSTENVWWWGQRVDCVQDQNYRQAQIGLLGPIVEWVCKDRWVKESGIGVI